MRQADGEILLLRTTGEDPFYRFNSELADADITHPGEWVAAKDLSPRDCILCADGNWLIVDELHDTGEWEPVYNMRVADWHCSGCGML